MGAPAATLSPKPGRPNSRAASPGGPSNSWDRSCLDAPAGTGSTSWRTTPNANSRSNSAPRALSTVKPAASARSRATANNTVLPIPAGPSTTSAPPRPCPARPACPHPLQLSIPLKQQTVALTHERNHNPPYVESLRIARRPSQTARPAFTSPRTTFNRKVRGDARGFPGANTRGADRTWTVKPSAQLMRERTCARKMRTAQRRRRSKNRRPGFASGERRCSTAARPAAPRLTMIPTGGPAKGRRWHGS